ncbi:YcdB/YcdC domain-containing protein [Paenibacillus dakarensis]|uniref:YcdB/YcdC domain-containing protein n=1 Tax=Paenibacillus dakarensis TaxID=1527293 RepID=UPI000ACBC812|nr:YcdB/YcdC domain-containing protein [Paenibacillus dakarensis]
MKNKSTKSVQMKSAVCAVTAMLCLAQPVWGDGNNETVSVNKTEVEAKAKNASQDISSEIPAGAKISGKQAEETIKRLFPLLRKATVSSVELSEQNNYGKGLKVWEVMFSFQRGNASSGFSGSVNAVTGEVVSVHIPRDLLTALGEGNGPSLSREDASKKAQEWIKQNMKNINVNDLNENPMYMGGGALFSPPTYDFYYNVSVNGVQFDGNTISLSIDDQGRIFSFNRNQTQNAAISTTAKISAAEAMKIYEKSFAAELSYIPSTQYGRSTGPYFLGYVPKTGSNLSIDANTGKMLDMMGEPAKADQYKPVEIPAGKEGFTPSPKPLASGEEAVQWVESHITIPAKYKVSSKRLGKRWNDKDSSVWSISYRNNDNTPFGRELAVEVDAKTGQIYEYNKYFYRYESGPDKDKEPGAKNISKQEAEQMAFTTVSKLVPDAAKEWKLTSITEPGKSESYPNYQFSFTRYAGGIPIMGDHISLMIGTDGQLNRFSSYYAAKISELPLNTKPVVTEEEAKAAFLKDTELKLKVAQYGGYISVDGSPELQSKLVYAPSRKDAGSWYDISLPLDAVTGKWRNTLPAEYLNIAAGQAQDTKGHKSEAALDKMVQSRVLVPDADQKVFPDQEITTGDWYLYVARALNPSVEQQEGYNTAAYGSLKPEDKYYNAIQALVAQNWLPYDPEASFSTERKLSRDELAFMLTRILKYEKLALSFTKDDQVPGVSDSDKIVNKGAAIITMKLGLIQPVDGKYMPQQIVTRAEAADVLLRLSKLAGKSDSFLKEYMW